MRISINYPRFLLFILLFAGAGLAHAQSPYAGQQTRNIKALSAAEIDDYLNGRGMGLAKAAELNRYPGPRHVLDLAEDLDLGKEQIEKSTALFNSMQAGAIELGTRLIEKERELDQLFASKTIDPDKLKALLNEIGSLNAQLRYAHLHAHLEQTALLSQDQIQRYNHLRGYDNNLQHSEHHHAH